MKEPLWLTLEVVMATQEELLARFGGLPGVREPGLLESALNRPRQRFHYDGAATLYELAAAYTAGLVRNHPFVDGNKRIGFMAAYIFLGANGIEIIAPEEDVVHATLALAAGELDEPAYAAWLERACA